MINRNVRLTNVVRLLEAVKSNPVHAKTRQFQTSKVNVTVCMEVADFLVERGFLRIVPIGSHRFNYHITSEGLFLLKQINWCFDAIADKHGIGVMQFA